jgi:uncharacterized membrane protein YdjX (TVP38/TMEM64 family)
MIQKAMNNPSNSGLSKPERRSVSGRGKLVIGALLVGALVVALKFFNAEAALQWIAGLGPLGPLIFIGIYIGAAVLFIPGSILSLGAGAAFGVVKGSIYVSIGATLGATCAFLIGRYLARDWVAKKLQGNANFTAIDHAVATEGWKIVGLARLSPVFPFNLLNYAFGLTNIPLTDYFLASWIGMIPGIVMYVYIGSLIGDVARIGGHPARRVAGQWALEIAGLIATVAVVVYVTRLARQALQRRTDS